LLHGYKTESGSISCKDCKGPASDSSIVFSFSGDAGVESFNGVYRGVHSNKQERLRAILTMLHESGFTSISQ